jgi:hypothetical protein
MEEYGARVDVRRRRAWPSFGRPPPLSSVVAPQRGRSVQKPPRPMQSVRSVRHFVL